MDVLADLLSRAQARGALFAHSTLRAPWGLSFVDEGVPLSVHAVLDGELWLEREGAQAERLVAGDVALVRSDGEYRFVHAPGAPARAIADVATAAGGRRFSVGAAGGRVTELLCGAFRFEGQVCDSLLDALPETTVVRGARDQPAVRATLDLLALEAARDAPGQQTVLDRSLDLLLVFVLRAHFAAAGDQAPRWFAALDDPVVGAALRALHADPARPWTVAALARECALSRTAFARRFTEAVGRPPLAYLSAWRMTLARDALLRPGTTLDAVAAEVGYSSAFAFSAAFKRAHGVAPGRWRTAELARVAA